MWVCFNITFFFLFRLLGEGGGMNKALKLLKAVRLLVC